MAPDSPSLDHSIIHADAHASRVRVVLNEQVHQAIDEFRFLFPPESVLTRAMGCQHTCIYTRTASASIVAEVISEHLRAVEHKPI